MPAARTRTLALTEPYPLKIEDLGRKSPASDPSPPLSGADGETRTLTAFATAPSRRRVYQFHHVGVMGLKRRRVRNEPALKAFDFTTSAPRLLSIWPRRMPSLRRASPGARASAAAPVAAV